MVPAIVSYAVLTEATAGAAMEAFVAALPARPPACSGAGIVIPAGGLRYLVNAWVCVCMLRRHGCRLPIQLWHLGSQEMPGPFAGLFEALGVELVDAQARRTTHPVRSLCGWALKPYAVLACPFRHVILLDADNVPVVDPSFLFETPQYRETGALFWPDAPPAPPHLANLTADHPVWRLCGVAPRGDGCFESGQLCIDKLRCWRALRLCLWMNEHADFWYRILFGDKDTFQIAWRKTDTPFAKPAQGPRILPAPVFLQLDFTGRVVFQHRHGDKWRLDGRNRRIPGFLDEDFCRQCIAELRSTLFARVGAAHGPVPARLENRRFVFTPSGDDPQLIAFAPDGLIEASAPRSVSCWRVEGDELVLFGNDLRHADRLCYAGRMGAWLSIKGGQTSLVPIG
jgi:hypothetical protein